jgi:hypothetical protein
VPTIIATPGAADANSYLTLAEAVAYFASRLHTTVWDAAVDATREKALIMATKWIDALSCFTGAAASSTQALKWPRTGMTGLTGHSISSSIIPQTLKDATAEFAQQLISSDRTVDSAVETQGITSIKAGPVQLGFKDSVTAKVLPDAVTNLMVPSWLCEDDENQTARFQVI